MSYSKSYHRGCLRNTLGGCFSLLGFFFLIIAMLSSIEFPEFDLGRTTNANYKIDMDSLSTDQIIRSSFSWKFVGNDLSKKKYNLTFELLSKEVRKALNLIDKIGAMSFEELGLNLRYNYDDPDIQAQYLWARIYQVVYQESFPQVKTVAEGFNKIFLNEKMNAIDRVLFVISFVQNIKYDRPGGALDLFAPLGTIAKRFGDCDTKALLLYVLLERMRIDCAMMWSQYYKHAMLGVKIPTNGDYKIYNGKKYYFLETTYPGWKIGDLPPDFNNKRLWYILEIDATEESSGERNIDYKVDSDRSSKPLPANP